MLDLYCDLIQLKVCNETMIHHLNCTGSAINDVTLSGYICSAIKSFNLWNNNLNILIQLAISHTSKSTFALNLRREEGERVSIPDFINRPTNDYLR